MKRAAEVTEPRRVGVATGSTSQHQIENSPEADKTLPNSRRIYIAGQLPEVRVPFREIKFSKDGPGIFELIDREGQTLTIPLHRVKSVYKNGELIWHRE